MANIGELQSAKTPIQAMTAKKISSTLRSTMQRPISLRGRGGEMAKVLRGTRGKRKMRSSGSEVRSGSRRVATPFLRETCAASLRRR